MNLPWLDPVVERLEASLSAQRLPHGLLIGGTRGIGKNRLARWLAGRMLCLAPAGANACGQCRSCQLADSNTHPDFRIIAPEGPGGQIKVDEIRELIDLLNLTPGIGSSRVVVIEKAEQMNRSAANSLLKTLEEPSGDVWLILVSDRPDWLPATIRSRCMQLTIPVPDPGIAAEWLAQTRAPEPSDDGQDASVEPDARSPENLELALVLTGGAPLLAAGLLDRGRVGRAVRLLEDLLALETGQKHAASVVSEWTDEAGEGFEWLARWSAQAIRLKTIGESTIGEAAARSTALVRLAELDIDRLHAAYRFSLECRRLADTPMRADLLLTRWFSQWAKRSA